MPIYDVEANGKSYEIEAPNMDAAMSVLKGMNASAPSTAADVAKSAGAGVGKGVIGLAGFVGDMSDVGAKGLELADGYISEKLGMQPYKPPMDRSQSALANVPTSSSIQRAIEDNVTGKFYEPQTRAGRYAQSVGEFVPGAAIGPGGALAKAASVIGGGAGSEAAGELASNQSPGWQAAARVAGGTLGALTPAGLSRVVTPNPISAVRQRNLDVLNSEGVTSLTAGQRTGNKALQYAESILGDAPGAGQGASRIQQEGQRQFTEAAMRRAGQGLPDATPEVLAANNARLGNEFQQLSARNTLVPDNQMITDISDAVKRYRNVPDSQQKAILQGYIDDIIPHINAGGMPGVEYQPMRSMLSTDAKAVAQTDPYLSRALAGIRNALDDAMGRSISPADQEAWKTARREYGAQKTIEKVASGAGDAAAEGQVTPARLRNAAAAGNRGAYARGEGDFSELARAGSAVMAPLPNSGTGQRNAIREMLNAATLGAVPATAGRVLMSRPVQSYFANQLLPDVAGATPRSQALARALLAQDRTQLLEGPR